jgi:hypothetical protein
MADVQCLSTSNGDLVAARAAAPAAAASDPVQTDTIVATGVAGVIATLAFPIRPNKPTNTGRLQAVGSFSYEITVGGGAGSTGRLNLVLLKNGVVIAGVGDQQGVTRAFDGVAGPWRETLRVVVPSFLLDADDVFAIGVQIEIVNAVAGNATVQLHHDPAVLADSFPVNLPQVGDATEGLDGLMTAAAAIIEGSVTEEGSAEVFSSVLQTDTVVPTDGAPGVVATTDFVCRPRRPFSAERVDILALLNWEVTVAGGAGATGRINLTATKNGQPITGVVVANGTTRALDGIAGPWNEVLHIVIPALNMDLDDTLELGLEAELVVAGAAGNATMRLHHDPDTAGNELFFEMVGLG